MSHCVWDRAYMHYILKLFSCRVVLMHACECVKACMWVCIIHPSYRNRAAIVVRFQQSSWFSDHFNTLHVKNRSFFTRALVCFLSVASNLYWNFAKKTVAVVKLCVSWRDLLLILVSTVSYGSNFVTVTCIRLCVVFTEIKLRWLEMQRLWSATVNRSCS